MDTSIRPEKGNDSDSCSEEISNLLDQSADEDDISLKQNQEKLNAKLRTLSQSTSCNAYDSDLFEDSTDEEANEPKPKHYDLA